VGGKGASLARMARAGLLVVPHEFHIITEIITEGYRRFGLPRGHRALTMPSSWLKTWLRQP